MSEKFEYGTGRRKTATARTRIYAGSGGITVNGRSFEEYFPRKTLQMIIRQPLVLAKLAEQVGISNVNLSKIKNNKVTAVRFSTLAAICEALGLTAPEGYEAIAAE